MLSEMYLDSNSLKDALEHALIAKKINPEHIAPKQLIEIINLMEEYTLEEASISPFEIQKADEMFITNVITGIQPVSKYRKKQFATDVAKALLQKLNVKVRLS